MVGIPLKMESVYLIGRKLVGFYNQTCPRLRVAEPSIIWSEKDGKGGPSFLSGK